MEIADELRHAVARMLKAPGLPLGAVLAIGIGLGGAVAVFRVLGLVRWRVSQRSRELALRVALGATPGMVRRLLLTTEMSWVLAGMVTGAVFVFVAAPRLGPMLIFVNPRDPAILACVVAVLTAVALLAVFAHANRIAIGLNAFVASPGDRMIS